MNRLYAYLVYFFALFISVPAAVAQHDHEHCATMHMDSLLRAKYPQLGTLPEFERALQQKIAERKELEKRGRVMDEVLTIPIIVHIVHSGEAVGQGRNLSVARIQAQIETLNEDFRRAPGTPGFNNDPRGADIEIEFCLSRFDQQGRPMAEPGINRINGNRANWTRDDIENLLKPSSIWDPDRYYNIWVVDFASSESLVGYAQFPSQSGLPGIPNNSPRNTDGVVMRYQSFGNVLKGNFGNMPAPYNQGRTLTHETGHWLGLRHIWGDANCGNDFVDDTPPQASESRGCPVGRVSCGNVNMVQNYMDYSDDACMNIFTQDQKRRMRAVMEMSPRRNTLTRSNLCGTMVAGPPRANFRAETQQILLGGQVQFYDLSINFPTSWEWTFEGGTPVTTNQQNPIVTYNQPGRFRVKLVVRNSLGVDSLIRENYIEVLNVGLCADLTNFSGTRTLIPDTTRIGYVSGHNGRRIRAISEKFDNQLGYTTLTSASIRFGQAYARRGANTEETVTVVVWNARGFQGGPGAILEEKEVPLRQILSDVANNRPTEVGFDRPVPLFGLGFHVGVQFDYDGDSVAVVTTRNGEALRGTSWEQDAEGEWDLFLRRTGLNIAHDITARAGMKPSVQLAASTQFINPGESVTLQARGASIYNWAPATNLNSTIGPQVTARPNQTTTYYVKGGGADVCIDSAAVTLYVRTDQPVLGNEPTPDNLFGKTVEVSPNPSDGLMALTMTNGLRGDVQLTLYNQAGVAMLQRRFRKDTESANYPLDIRQLPPGTYVVEVVLGEVTTRKRIVKF
ncbi:M43 family zinc metalloprotease [Telluribacter sp. SYSU D00476]|uniref:M43 family zinc metalloprotease n=1 Tax=Telluribacter sp. SYSU D00476 TaxID=2811430 RepID=UPI001FF441E9|nr:M43 family zinc metalloprotease [Telluribacter sp. SYSU D00476]